MKKVTEVTKEVQSDNAIKERMYKHLSPNASAKDQKKFRSKQRRKLQNHCDAILIAKKQNKKEELTKLVSAFIKFYKSDYILNDFSLSSLYQGSKEIKVSEYNDLLKIVKSNMK